MIRSKFALTLTTLVCAFGASQAPARAQSLPDSVAIATNSRVRVSAPSLGAGWHDGRIVKISLSSGGDCYGVAPTSRTDIGAMTIDGVDSLEVWIDGTRKESATPQRDTVRSPGTWMGVTRARRQSLSKGCGPPRP